MTRKRFDLLDAMGWKRPDPSAARRFVAIAGNLLAVLVVVIILFLLAHFLYLLTDFDREENIRDIALALAGVIGFPVIVWRAVVHARQADIAQENLTTDLINKAVEGLGAETTVKRDGAEVTEPNLEVRIGAIYQLERIARTQAHSGTPQGAEDHIRIMKILCAYVRENSNARTPSEHGLMPWPDYPKKATGHQVKVRERWYSIRASAMHRWANALPKPRLDIQTAMEVLGGRDATQQDIEQADKRPGQSDGYCLDLRGANLQAAALAHLDFSRADFSRARMERAVLRGAKMERANLSEAKMERASLIGAKMEGADLSEAKMERVDLSWAEMEGAVFFEAKMEGATLIEAKMEEAKLIEAKMEEAKLRRTQMEGADLRWTKLERADLIEAKMERVKLSGARVERALLSGARMESAILSRARLASTVLSGTRMESADLSRTNFKSANWVGSIVNGSPAPSADFRGGLGLDQSRLSSLIGNAATLLPETPEGEPDLFVPSCWTEDPPGFKALVATMSRVGLPEDRLRDPDFGWFCAPGAVPMKTGTPWPVDQPPPWEQAEMDVADWLKLPENQPTEPVDPGGAAPP